MSQVCYSGRTTKLFRAHGGNDWNKEPHISITFCPSQPGRSVLTVWSREIFVDVSNNPDFFVLYITESCPPTNFISFEIWDADKLFSVTIFNLCVFVSQSGSGNFFLFLSLLTLTHFLYMYRVMVGHCRAHKQRGIWKWQTFFFNLHVGGTSDETLQHTNKDLKEGNQTLNPGRATHALTTTPPCDSLL